MIKIVIPSTFIEESDSSFYLYLSIFNEYFTHPIKNKKNRKKNFNFIFRDCNS